MFPFRRPTVQAPYLVSASTVLLIGFGVLVFLAVTVTRQSEAVRKEGAAACVEAGHTEEVCADRAEEHHRRCMNMTYQRGSRRNPGTSFDKPGYVTCILEGPEAFRQSEYEKRKAAEAQGNNRSML